MIMPFVVVGTWSQTDKIVHQEIVMDDSLREKYNAIHEIQYTDGTFLSIETYELGKPPQRLGYKPLLDKAIAQNKSGYISVRDIRD